MYMLLIVISKISRLYLVSLVLCVATLLQFPTVTHAGETKRGAADTIIRNGVVYTVDKSHPRAEAIAVKQGEIVFVGSNKDDDRYRISIND